MASDQGSVVPQSTWRERLRSLRSRADQLEHEQPEPVIARGSAVDLMIVVQFRPAWELQAYLRFARLPYRVENSLYVGCETTGLYPALTDGQFMIPGGEAAGHLSRRRRSLDRNLTEEEKAEAEAFCLVVKEGLQPLLRILRYAGNEGEITQTVYPPMKKTLPWPLKWWSPGAEGRRSEREATLRGFGGLAKDELVARASTLYASLDLRLGDKEAFYFGATPTSLDACVFGHLAEAWTVGALLDLLPAFENLSRFFRHVCDEYFRPGSPPVGIEGGRRGDAGVAESKGVYNVDEGGGEWRGGRQGTGGSDGLREALMRADYVNSLNAFNQLPGCALCAEVPYIDDPYPPKPLINAGIPSPVLAGGVVETDAAPEEAANAGSQSADDALPLKYTAYGTVLFFVFSMFAGW